MSGAAPPAGDALLAVLGAGTILPRAGYGAAGYALRPSADARWTLFDCGPGSLRALGELGLGLGDVERVVLSHYHPDHCLDLFALFFARRNPQVRDLPELEVIGPAGLTALVSGGVAALGRWVEDPRARLLEFAVEPNGIWEVERSGMSLRARPNGHTPHAVSWRVRLPSGFVWAYSGDSGPDPRLVELARGADLFVCESALPDTQPSEHHLTPAEAGRIAHEARVRELLLTHFYPALSPEDALVSAKREYAGPVRAAHDGLVVQLQTPLP